MQPDLYILLWISIGFLVGGLLYLTVLAFWLATKAISSAPRVAGILLCTDAAIGIFLFVWPFSVWYDLNDVLTDYLFFGSIVTAVLALSFTFHITRLRAAKEIESSGNILGAWSS